MHDVFSLDVESSYSIVSVHPDKHVYAWHKVVSSDSYADVVACILQECPPLVDSLAHATDADDRPILNIASPQCKVIIQEAVNMFKQYEVGNFASKNHSLYST